MACCGSNRNSPIGSTGNSIAQPIGIPDGSLAPIHPSWLDPAATIDPTLIPDGVIRSIDSGSVRIVVNPGPNQFVVLDADRLISTAKRQMFWGQYPQLTQTIAKVAPTIAAVPPTPIV